MVWFVFAPSYGEIAVTFSDHILSFRRRLTIKKRFQTETAYRRCPEARLLGIVPDSLSRRWTIMDMRSLTSGLQHPIFFDCLGKKSSGFQLQCNITQKRQSAPQTVLRWSHCELLPHPTVRNWQLCRLTCFHQKPTLFWKYYTQPTLSKHIQAIVGSWRQQAGVMSQSFRSRCPSWRHCVSTINVWLFEFEASP